jgi:ceramide glucosyltransferase
MTVMRLMRPWGHFGLIFTWGLPWSLFAIAVHPTVLTAAAYLGTYAVLRVVITWLMGTWGMKQKELWRKFPLIPLWDLVAFLIWVVSFGRKTIRWRGVNYGIKNGMLVAADPASAQSISR